MSICLLPRVHILVVRDAYSSQPKSRFLDLIGYVRTHVNMLLFCEGILQVCISFGLFSLVYLPILIEGMLQLQR